MDVKKRFFVLRVVVIILFLVLLSSVHAIVTTPILFDGNENCDRRLENLRSLEDPYNAYESDCKDDKEYEVAIQEAPEKTGCAIGVYEIDDVDDDCGISFVSSGTIITQEYQKLSLSPRYFWEADEGMDDNPPSPSGAGWPDYSDEDDSYGGYSCFDQQMRTRKNNYLCHDDQKWYQCDSDSSGEVLRNEKLAEYVYCLSSKWVVGPLGEESDADGDKVPDLVDCGPNDQSVHASYPRGCANDRDLSDCIQTVATVICGDGKPNTCGEVANENDDCNADPEACNAQGMHHVSNVVDGNGYCCGSGGISDLGKLSTDKSKVCLSNNQLVRAEDSNNLFSDCKDDQGNAKKWCWVPAFTEFFNIITVDKFTETYDLVSNGEKWSECRGAVKKLELPAIDVTSNRQKSGLKAKSRQFQCYDEGNHFSWARCIPTGEEVSGIKQRSADQGQFLLAAVSSSANYHLLESSLFSSHYGDDHLWDFGGYDYLKLDVKFSAGWELPLDLNLKIYGDTADKIYFDSNVLGYANSSIVADQFVHLKIPIQDNLKGVKMLAFATVIESNKVELKNVYLTKESNNLFCSGETTINRESNWVGSLDEEKKIFNVEYEVEFDYDAKEWNYPEKSFGWTLISHAFFETPLSADGDHVGEDDVKISFASSPIIWGPFIMKVTISDADPSFNHYLMQKFDDAENKISLKPYYFDGEKLAEINLNEPGEYGRFSFDLRNMELGKYDLYLKAEYTAEDNGIVIDKSAKKTETFTPVCLINEAKKECLYSVPGLPEEGFTIENKHPYLYDLYFIDKNEKETLITADHKEFSVPGNIIARKVPDSVLVTKNDANEDVFYGCSAAKYILDQNNKIEKLNSCAIKETMICSVDDNGRLNSWNETKFETAHFSSILPGKNLLSNAEFSTQGRKITYWQLLKDGQVVKGDFRSYLEENDDSPAGKVLKLSRNELLISERIAVPALTRMHFSDSADGCGEVYVIDQDGQAVKQDENIFETPENVLAVQIKFVGKILGCKISQPSLQILDGTPASFTAMEEPVRITGAGCCAPASCWNGQACVEDMSANPQLKEQSGDKSYRCINGSWQNAVIKKDWNQDKEGYCVTEQQCFVSSQTITLDKEYPVCINDQQYVLDHHCSKGNWTSRTKYVAEQLLTLLDQGDDYSLYCDTFRNVLPEYEKVIVQGVVSNAPFNDNTCFQHPGQGPASYEENTCFNNVCILIYSKGSKTKTAFGATLNKPVNELLFPALGANGQCPENTAGFEPCSDAYGRKIFYSSKLNAVIYAEDAPGREPTLLERISEIFRNFFGLSNSLAEQGSFLQQAQNFRELFLLSKDEKSVSAIKESARRTIDARTDDQWRIIAEYKNFQSPVCDYLNQQRIDFFRVPFAEDQISCAKTAGLQRVEINSSKEGTDILWPQMTAKLRVE